MARYAAFEQTGCDRIAVAHTRSDRIETSLFHLARGTSLKGAAGIPPRRGKVIRPLIDCTRTEIEAYAAEHNLSYITDETNFTDAYTRNAIRHRVVEPLREIIPSFEANWARFLDTAATQHDYLRRQANLALEQAKTDSDAVIISGGSSQGKKDMTAMLIDEAADHGVLTHGIAAKPGKPTITGYDEASRTLFIGLPGHPAAALMVYEQVFINLWRDLTGREEERTLRARVKVNVPSAPGRMTFQLVKVTGGDEPEAVPVFARSGMISPVSEADGYFVMTENQEGVRPGDKVDVHLWR